MYILNGDENSNILSIEFTNEEMDMCDITIDSDEHSYYINGIETHNCSQEALLLALLSKDNKMIQNFKDGIDPHTATAYGIWGRENYSKGLRKLAKACLGEDSYILTKRGLIRPSDLNRDDKIIDKNGNEQNYLLEKDYGDLIRVEYDTGIVEEYTPNHKLYVWTGKDFIWKEVQEVTSEDNIVQVTNFKYEVGGVDRIVDITPKKVYNKNYKINTSCKEFSYLMGLYLGDGYIDIKKNLAGDTYGGFISWVVSDEALDKVKSYIDFLGLGHSSSFKVGKNKIANVIKVFHSHFAFYIKDTFGTCKNKNIPDWVFKTWNKQTIKYFIAGLIDSDGSKRSCSLVFSNTNINIINKLASLCAIVGIKTKIKNRYTKYKGERYSFYELSLYDIQEKLPLLNSYKQVCGTGATRLGSWEIDKNYYKEEIHYKKITFKKYPDKIKDGSQNIISGRSRLTSNLIRMFEEYNIEIPIDSSMQMAKIRNKNYKKGNIYVIQTDNHEYISNCTVSHNCNFAINYGGNFRTIAKNAEIPIDQAKEIYEAYEEAFFESVQWKQNEISKMWKSGGTAYTIFGRPRRFGSYVKMAEKIIQEAEDPLKGERESDNLVSAAERRVASHQIQGCH
ncbi:MAG: LAGLIDADG family homing endonuclease, partial [Nanoarchaeota archaeon]